MKKFIKKALPVSVLSCVLVASSTISALAAPTELYGYKKMDLIEFHKVVYDKNGNPRVFPKNKTFKTTIEKGENTDVNSSASKHEEIVAKRVKRSADAMSGASKKGGNKNKDGVDAVGGASGGFVGADVVFDFELISNAIIIHNLGIKNENVEKILEAWATSTKTVVAKDNVEEGYSWEDFVNKAAEAYANGKDLTFEEYVKLKDKKVAKLPPNAKYILEDGTLGTRLDRKEIGGKESPNVSNDNLNNKLNSDIVLNYVEDRSWTNAIESITVGKEDYNKKKIALNDVKFEGDKITIDKKYFKLGENVITFTAKGYKTVVVTQFVYKDKIEITVKEGKLGQDVVLTADNKEYLKEVKFINLNGRVLDQEKGQWKVENESIVLSKEIFTEEGDYKVLINTDGKYDIKLLNLKVTKNGANNDGVALGEKVLPKIAPVEVNKNNDIVFSFDPNLNWQKAITKIEKVDPNGMAPLNDKLQFRVSDGKLTIIQYQYLNTPGEYTLRVFADGYEPIDIKAIVVGEAPEIYTTNLPYVNYDLAFKSTESGYRWIDNLSEVLVNGKKLDKEMYHTAGNLVVLHKEVFTKPGLHSFVFKSKGYPSAVKQLDVLQGNGTIEENNLKDAPEVKAKQIILTKNEDLVLAVNDKEWTNGLKIVQVNSNKVNNFNIKDNNITIPYTYFKEGKNTVELLAQGYRKAFLNVNLAKTVPIDVKAFEAKEGFDVTIDLGYDKDYVVSEVVLNGKNLKENDDYRISPQSWLIINKALVKTGANEVTIKADGYYDKSFNIDVKKKEAPKPVEKPVEIPSAKAMLWHHSVDQGKVLEIDKTNGDYTVDSITFNGKEVGFTQDKSKITPDITSLEPGNYEIILKANGYKDGKYTILINKKKEEVKPVDTKPNQPKPDELKSAKAMLWLHSIEEGKSFNIDKTDENYEVESITFNGQDISFTQDNKVITPDIASLKPGNYEIVLKAKGYKDGKLTIIIYAKKQVVKKEPVKLVETKVENISKKDTVTTDTVKVEEKKEEPKSVEVKDDKLAKEKLEVNNKVNN